MPVYEYRCTSCLEELELMRPISEADESADCPSCGSEAWKLVSGYACRIGTYVRPFEQPFREEERPFREELGLRLFGEAFREGNTLWPWPSDQPFGEEFDFRLSEEPFREESEEAPQYEPFWEEFVFWSPEEPSREELIEKPSVNETTVKEVKKAAEPARAAGHQLRVYQGQVAIPMESWLGMDLRWVLVAAAIIASVVISLIWILASVL